MIWFRQSSLVLLSSFFYLVYESLDLSSVPIPEYVIWLSSKVISNWGNHDGDDQVYS
jgi:hypothetical protein